MGENATVVSHDRITFAATLTGTRLTYDADLRLKGLLRIADPLLGLAFRRIGHRAPYLAHTVVDGRIRYGDVLAAT